LISFGNLKRKIECCSEVHFAFCPNSAAVPVDYSLHVREPYASAFEFTDRMQALERSEQFFGIRHVKTSSIIANEVNRAIVLQCLTNFYISVLPILAEFPGIAQKVLNRKFEQPAVPYDDKIQRCGQFNRPMRLISLKAREYSPSNNHEINLLEVNLAFADPG
jgi:hypothetical protein